MICLYTRKIGNIVTHLLLYIDEPTNKLYGYARHILRYLNVPYLSCFNNFEHYCVYIKTAPQSEFIS